MLRERLRIALDIPGLDKIAKRIADSKALSMAADSCSLSYSDYTRLKSQAEDLDKMSEVMFNYLKSVYSESLAEPHLITIRLPTQDQLGSVSHSIQELDDILSQCLSILDEPSTVRVIGWERGSLWIDIALGAPIAVTCIGALAWSAVCVLKKYRESQLIEKLVEAQNVKNEMLEDLRKTMRDSLNTLISAEARRLDENHSKKKGDPETIQRLTHCVRSLFEMMQQGAEVHPALMAPQEVKDAFPKMDEVLGLPSTTKLLKDHRDSETDSGEASDHPPSSM
ncbi:MAG: hypothetical protein JNJ83_11395 [Verrucomicrobiaceae bacterium]|nr:hypothetical protein [Verrucomicrobiaceae bacterium]